MVAATTLLASHLGPDRSHRTSDASRLDDPAIRGAELHRLGAFALTMADGGRHLALRVHDSVVRFPHPGQLRVGRTVADDNAGRARRSRSRCHQRPPDAEHAHRALDCFGRRRCWRRRETATRSQRSRTSFDRVRLFAHRQAYGELAVGIDAVRAYATVGMLVAMHGHAIAAAAGSVQRDQSDQPRRRASRGRSSAAWHPRPMGAAAQRGREMRGISKSAAAARPRGRASLKHSQDAHS